MSHFGELVRTLLKQRGFTMEVIARKLDTHKGYISSIEAGQVNPPSIKLIRKYAKLLGQDLKHMVRLAWVDKAPEIIREEGFLKWCESRELPEK